MADAPTAAIHHRWSERVEIALAFLKIGAISYGGAGIMGIMQAEIQEKRRWVSREQFVEGLALVNMLPGPIAAQLAMFLGYARGGAAGAMLAGLCFILPAFVILLGLTLAYSVYGSLPLMRAAFYGVAPVVIGIFAVAVYRLSKASVKEPAQFAMAVAAAVLAAPVGLVTTLLACGCIGVALFCSTRNGLIALALVLSVAALVQVLHLSVGAPMTSASAVATSSVATPDAFDLALFFAKVGAFTFGGGLSVLAFIQEQVVARYEWLNAQQFLDGLALGQLTPGPPLMIAAFVGYAVGGFAGAVASAAAIFLPAFVLMLVILPALQKLQDARWLKAFMRGVGPAVIGAMAVSLAQLAVYAVSDVPTALLLLAAIALAVLRNVGSLLLIAGGGLLGIAVRGDVVGRVMQLVA